MVFPISFLFMIAVIIYLDSRLSQYKRQINDILNQEFDLLIFFDLHLRDPSKAGIVIR